MTESRNQQFTRRDVVLVNFLFSEETGSKRRPVLVLSSPEYHDRRQESVVCAVTSNTRRVLPGDLLMDDWEYAGLPLPTVVTGIIRTIKKGMIERRLGPLSDKDMANLEINLINTLGLQR